MAQDYYLNERDYVRAMLYPAPGPWRAAVLDDRARLLADLDRLGTVIEHQRRAQRARAARPARAVGRWG